MMVVHSLFLGDYTSFQLTFQSLVPTSRVGRILVYSYQLCSPFPGLFGRALFIQSGKGLSPSRIWFSCTAIRGCNDVSFLNQYPCTSFIPGAFELGILMHCIFTISWLISTLSVLFTFKPLLLFFNSTSFASQRAAAIANLFVWVTSSVLICLITAFPFLVTSLNFLWSTFLKSW